MTSSRFDEWIDQGIALIVGLVFLAFTAMFVVGVGILIALSIDTQNFLTHFEGVVVAFGAVHLIIAVVIGIKTKYLSSFDHSWQKPFALLFWGIVVANLVHKDIVQTRRQRRAEKAEELSQCW